MHTTRSKWLPFRTIRSRLMIWNALVVVITAIVTLLTLREGTRITLIRELDELLRDDLQEIKLALLEHEDSQTLFEQLDRRDAGHAKHNKWFAELVDGSGRFNYKSEHAPPESVWSRPSDSPIRTIAQWRLLSSNSDDGTVTIRVGASLELIHVDIARLDRIVALAAGGALIVAPLCGYWLAGRATRPLQEIIATTARLRPAQLQERLEIRGTGDELDQLSESFNRLLDRIGHYMQERRDFLANAAHELRTPLAAIHASTEVALNGERSKEEYAELLGEILDETRNLEILVNQLLLLSETEAERLKLTQERVMFHEIVSKAMDMFNGVAEHREIRLVAIRLTTPVIVLGNRDHLRQVVYNLLDNALKFTQPGKQVCVELRKDETLRQVEFIVRDQGTGIPPEELPHVFERFFQAHRPRTGHVDRRGTGLGLSICQAVVRAHGGTIELGSQLGQGTTVVVRLPCDPS